ncbi:MAG: Rieske 2Fe-2S protein [Noviherbaspirillum sp.]|jgi:nitrite reductase/ring-hydroxylating ferredoxin subunit|nr:Rieske 2Fe-2S protein [Noviherbaspirillum sp.]
MMTEDAIYICPSDALINGAKGVRFPVTAGNEDASGFVIRYRGTVYGYLNRCAHVPIELDWNQGDFFDSDGLYLMCSTHGAIYTPQDGRCAGGPCRGGRLRSIQVCEEDSHVFWQPDDYLRPVRA